MDAVKRHPMFPFLLVMTLSSTVGFQAWHTLFNNFAVVSLIAVQFIRVEQPGGGVKPCNGRR